VIETVQRPTSTASRPERTRMTGSDEAQDGRARQHVLVAGEEKAVERRPGRVSPAPPKGWASCRGPGEPQERSGDETSPAWFRAEKAVESVRNAEDGRCRRLDVAGSYGRLGLSSAVGAKTSGEAHSHAHAGAVDGQM
jgi:hypothetical protein